MPGPGKPAPSDPTLPACLGPDVRRDLLLPLITLASGEPVSWSDVLRDATGWLSVLPANPGAESLEPRVDMLIPSFDLPDVHDPALSVGPQRRDQ